MTPIATRALSPTARRRLAEVLPESVAFAANEFIVGPLLDNLHRVSKRFHAPLSNRHSAQRAPRHLSSRLPGQNLGGRATAASDVHHRGAPTLTKRLTSGGNSHHEPGQTTLESVNEGALILGSSPPSDTAYVHRERPRGSQSPTDPIVRPRGRAGGRRNGMAAAPEDRLSQRPLRATRAGPIGHPAPQPVWARHPAPGNGVGPGGPPTPCRPAQASTRARGVVAATGRRLGRKRWPLPVATAPSQAAAAPIATPPMASTR